MAKDHVSENQFANALIKYVQNNPDVQLKNVQKGEIPDHWVGSAEGLINRRFPLTHHGLFDDIFHKKAIIPKAWFDFERQYRLPEADLVERIYQECQMQGVADWKPEQVRRNAFHVTHDFWSDATQEGNYQRILEELKGRGLITEPTRSYADEPNAVGLRVGDRVVDLPSSYRNLRYLYNSLHKKGRYQGDFPQDIAKYGGIIPVVFMVGDTIQAGDERFGEHEDLSPKQELFQLVAEHTSPTPKYQSIMYVFGEKEGEEITPRTVGQMNAFIHINAYATPVGHILGGMGYKVPQDDMVEEERKSLDLRPSDWKNHHRYFLESHPKIQADGRE